jgi:hypothetical protein
MSPDQLEVADHATLKRLWRQRIDTERAGKDDPVIHRLRMTPSC